MIRACCFVVGSLLLLSRCTDDSPDERILVKQPLLTDVTDQAGNSIWQLDYNDDCQLVSAVIDGPMTASWAPFGYTNPLRIGRGKFTVDFSYEENRLATIRIEDLRRGQTRLRSYGVVHEGDNVSGLRLESSTIAGFIDTTSARQVEFYYDQVGRIVSTYISNGNSIAYGYDNTLQLTSASYRFGAQDPITEFYAYDVDVANPFASLPLRYVLSYAAFQAERPVTLATFDGRLYKQQVRNGSVFRTISNGITDSTTYHSFMYVPNTCD